MIAAILMREYVGYNVVLNVVPSSSRVFERTAKLLAGDSTDGSSLETLHRAGERFGYTNLEVWPAGRHTGFDLITDRKIVDLGLLGYEGRGGLFVAGSFARRPDLRSQPPEFYRAYDASLNEDGTLLAELRNASGVDCGSAHCCCARASRSCPKSPIANDLVWCPSHSDGVLPGVLARDHVSGKGFIEAIAQSNGLRMGIRYVGKDTYDHLAESTLSSDRAEVVYAWRPSTLLTRLRASGKQPVRVVLPSDGCGSHDFDDRGNSTWSCDFPTETLRKLSSVDADVDPVALDFLTSFKMPESPFADHHIGATSGVLVNGGIRELLQALVVRVNGTRPPTGEEIFETACAWIHQNDGIGQDWRHWSSPRRVPVFADTTNYWYLAISIFTFFVGAIGLVLFIEYPWLWTTLNFRSVKAIRSKNVGVHWRSPLERKEREACQVEDEASLSLDDSDSTILASNSWQGLGHRCLSTDRLRSFWQQAVRLDEAHKECSAHLTGPPPLNDDFVSFVHHTFPCLIRDGEVCGMLRRSAHGVNSGRTLTVKVVPEECGGGAKSNTHFAPAMVSVRFDPGVNRVGFKIPVIDDAENWDNSKWFRLRLVVYCGALEEPAEALVLLLSDVRWPADIPLSKRKGSGISLMRHFIKSDRARRGAKWTKTMLAMVWLPVHSVFVSTIVQKLLVDHAAENIRKSWVSGGTVDPVWFYLECVALVSVQLVSLALNRWADVVQTRNRGRTGGSRQVHRANLLRKFIFLDHAEHWWASDAHWLYSAIYDADVITGKAYFQVFVLFQSIGALVMSLTLAVGLFLWVSVKSGQSQSVKGEASVVSAVPFAACLVLILPLGMLGVYKRRRFTWLAVLVRKQRESQWFASCVWVMSQWRMFYGLTVDERLQMEKRVLSQNDAFVPAHWDARDTMNDTGWLATWIQGIAYGFMLLFGVFAFIEHEVYGIGAMEVGTFYALCKIYIDVGKYARRLSGVFVSMEAAVVSLREISALLNQTDQQVQRHNARAWAGFCQSYACTESGQVAAMSSTVRRSVQIVTKKLEASQITFEAGMCFLRPSDKKIGSIFGEFRLTRACVIELGRFTCVHGSNERIVCSFLGLCAQVLHHTGPTGELPRISDEDNVEESPGVIIPYGLRMMMVSTLPPVMCAAAPTIMEQLSSTHASEALCTALVECVGLDPLCRTPNLSHGDAHVFSIAKALLTDPDVLCIFRPLALVPCDIRPRIAMLLRLWQRGGGIAAIAKLFGIGLELHAYRRSERTLIVGNSDDNHFSFDKAIDIDEMLWKSSDAQEVLTCLRETDGFAQESRPLPAESSKYSTTGAHDCSGLPTQPISIADELHTHRVSKMPL
eukprot:TRINITY_DN37864_c0_g1_i1.p1 TRINITY_DN37864_c0_g1~~TRINITY_DN37864_c0_g1_i1.p1  ORF type:complete len:1459 (-),score=173.83 TRINITY_DN37864_c0_g1_i1:364-4392(-)